MRLEELDYDLPEELIAQRPLERRDASRLFLPERDGDDAHRRMTELPSLLEPSLIVWNDARVIPARLRGARPTGGKAELLLIEPAAPLGARAATDGRERWRAMGRANRPLRAGDRLVFGEALDAEVVEKLDAGHLIVDLSPRSEASVLETLEAVGEMPLPPYIARATEDADRERYQTVFARTPGAIAAPTAGLHFTDELRDALSRAGHEFAYVTLHVGPGTFRPVSAENLDEHPMHRERYAVPDETAAALERARMSGRRVMAVGTTVMRTLEAAALAGDGVVNAGEGDTDLFIRPGFTFRVVDTLLTNFHLPRSTLLALVMAFIGTEPTRDAYRRAVEARYRFFSYGDAMLIHRREGGSSGARR